MDNVRHLNLPALFGAASDVQNRNVLRRINALKMREAEKGVEKRELRNELARRYFNPGEPASVEGRPAMSEGNAIGKYLRGGPEIDTYTPAETTVKEGAPPSFDYRGYGNALAKAGDVEGALDVHKTMEGRETAALDRKKTELDIEKSRVNILNTIDQMNERDRERTLKNIELIGSSQAGVYTEYEKLLGSGVPEPEARQRVQPLYTQSVSYLTRNGMGAGKLPPSFDPEVSRAAVDLAMSVKDQFARADGDGREGAGKLTPTQESNNREIDEARSILERKNLSKEEILRRTQKYTDTGRMNANYDPYIESIVKKATQRKVGEDPGFEEVYGKYIGGVSDNPVSTAYKDPKGAMAEMPEATLHNGRVIKDTETGKRFRSDGSRWVEIR